MDSRSLTLSAIDGVPERIPFNPFIMHLAASLVDIDYSRVYCQDAEELANAQIECAKLFGIDHVNVSTDAFREASAWGVEIDFSGHTPVPKKGTNLNWREFELIENPNLLEVPRIQNRIEAVRLLRKKAPNQCVIGWIEAPFAELCSIFDMIEVIKIWMQKDWERIFKNLLERIRLIQLEFAKLQIEAGADIIGAGDSAISQIGPKRYKLTTLTATQKLFREIKKVVPVLYHVCGDNSRVDRDGNDMLKLIMSSGASIVDIDYQVDLLSAKQKIGKEICIRGNTDTRILGNPIYSSEKVIQVVTETVEAGKPNGMYMFAAGCEWPWEPLEIATRNLSAAKDITTKHGKY
ncbi:MAG: hypothetical protein HWN65_17690 [Candidatus Helarchaeota archaeon]|nr:hypothetical protein [Candidatus Helarchaeota archaeon]